MDELTSGPVVITGGSVLDVESGRVLEADVAVADGRIDRVGRGLTAARTIDATGLTLVPAVIDTHVHLLTTRVDVWRLATTPLSYRVCEAVDNLAVTLAGGVTTVRDAGGIDAGIAMAANGGLILGPRVQASIGMVCQTGGHADGWTLSGVDIPTLIPRFPGVPQTVVDGPDEVRRAVRRLVRAGAEVIKIATSGRVLSPRDNLADRRLDDQELAALRRAAAGRRGESDGARPLDRRGSRPPFEPESPRSSTASGSTMRRSRRWFPQRPSWCRPWACRSRCSTTPRPQDSVPRLSTRCARWSPVTGNRSSARSTAGAPPPWAPPSCSASTARSAA